MITIQFAGAKKDWETYKNLLPEALKAKGLEAEVLREVAAEEVDYIVYAPTGPVQDFSAYSKLKAVLSLWAGVERVVGNKTLKAPLSRMVDNGLREGMAEWVTGHVLRYHLGMDAQIVNPEHMWQAGTAPPLASDRRIGILGLGELGQASAKMLNCIGFDVAGWSRSAKNVLDVTCYSGAKGLQKILECSDIIVLLLPQTSQTNHIINAETLALLPRGAKILNPGRGPLIDDDALLAALDSGQISHATLDVFEVEPLPQDHPYWLHPSVTVTPHIASETRAASATDVIVENIRRGESGEKYLFEVDRNAGY